MIFQSDKWICKVANTLVDATSVEAEKEHVSLVEQFGEEFRSRLRITNDVQMHKEIISVYKLTTNFFAGNISFCSRALRLLLMLIRTLWFV